MTAIELAVYGQMGHQCSSLLVKQAHTKLIYIDSKVELIGRLLNLFGRGRRIGECDLSNYCGFIELALRLICQLSFEISIHRCYLSDLVLVFNAVTSPTW